MRRAVVPLAPFECGEQVVDGRELGILREDAGRLQLEDECVEVDARSARDVRRRGEEPKRREAEREDRAELDDVSARLPYGELPGRLLDLVRDTASASRSTPPTSSTVIRRRFLAVAS